MAAPASRDTLGEIRYIHSHPSPEVVENGVITLGEPSGVSAQEYKKRRHMTTEPFDCLVVDARTTNGGLGSWDLDTHGFCCVPAPPPVDFNAKGWTQEYYPRVEELVRRVTGAKHACIMQHAKRTENPKSLTAAYARFAHADAGPGTPPMWRAMLLHRFGMSQEEVENSDLMMVNLWHPWERPAYKDPLCLLDCSSVDLAKDRVRLRYAAGATTYNTVRSQESMEKGDTDKRATDAFVEQDGMAKIMEERIYGKAGGPRPGMPPVDMRAFADPGLVGPTYAPGHRWVFCSDMQPEEAWLFKQYDEREGLAKCSFHNSFHDPFHDDKPKETHGRRSIEFRIMLTFPKATTASSRL